MKEKRINEIISTIIDDYSNCTERSIQELLQYGEADFYNDEAFDWDDFTDFTDEEITEEDIARALADALNEKIRQALKARNIAFEEAYRKGGIGESAFMPVFRLKYNQKV